METKKNAIDVLNEEILQYQIIAIYGSLNLHKDLEMLLLGIISLFQNGPLFLHVCITGYSFV